MKNIKNVFFTICAVVVASASFAQNNILNARMANANSVMNQLKMHSMQRQKVRVPFTSM